MRSPRYYCPSTRSPLTSTTNGLVNDNGHLYPFLETGTEAKIPVFLSDSMQSGESTGAYYSSQDSDAIYTAFLEWLFNTFETDEEKFRNDLVDKLSLEAGEKVLVTGAGLGNDLAGILEKIGKQGELVAQDISTEMVVATSLNLNSNLTQNLYLNVSDAMALPHPDSYFDAAFHFGGINLFPDTKVAVSEMSRVVKPGGRVLIGDEGIAPWLKDTDYGRIVINNNPLWASSVPISILPSSAADVHVTWVLGNCFYVIDFEVSENLPIINMDVPHKGWRGGTMRKRFQGQLEGVAPGLRSAAIEMARRENVSLSDWLERIIEQKLDSDGS